MRKVLIAQAANNCCAGLPSDTVPRYPIRQTRAPGTANLATVYPSFRTLVECDSAFEDVTGYGVPVQRHGPRVWELNHQTTCDPFTPSSSEFHVPQSQC